MQTAAPNLVRHDAEPAPANTGDAIIRVENFTAAYDGKMVLKLSTEVLFQSGKTDLANDGKTALGLWRAQYHLQL